MTFPGPILKECIFGLESGVHTLTRQLPRPLLLENPRQFRYLAKDSQTLQVLKTVGVVSGLNAILHLVRVGHHFEANIVLRSVSDALADIAVINEGHHNPGAASTAQKMVDEFFSHDDEERVQQILKGTAEPVPRVGRKKKHAAIDRWLSVAPNSKDVRRMIEASDAVLDGFAHHGYGQIMDLYTAGPTFDGFVLRGVRDPGRAALMAEFVPLFVHRALNYTANLLRELRCVADADKLIGLRNRLETSSEYPQGG